MFIRSASHFVGNLCRNSLTISGKSWLPPSSSGFTNSMRMMSTNISEKFDVAKDQLNTLKNDPGNEVKLKMYALFKQAVIGANTTSKPSAFNFVGSAKWTAWKNLESMTQDEAKAEYVKIVEDLLKAEGGAVEEETSSTTSEYKNLIVTQQDNYTKIILNRPTRKNAITVEMYEEIILALNEASTNNSVLTLITGAGDYYCSGNDLSNFMTIQPHQMKQIAIESGDLLRRYIEAYINFPKPLIAAVNGPAIGVAVTVLGLFDTVYASDKSTFSTPFSKLGQSPEGCSSYTFPKIMGHAKACEMMLFNRQMNSQEALDCGLVTRLFPHQTFVSDVENVVKEMASLPAKSLIYSKSLMRQHETELLHKVNQAECDRLVERWPSEDCVNAVMKFFQDKMK